MNNLSTVRIEIGGKHVPIFSRVSVRQWIDRHHTFELTVPIEQLEGEGGMTINQSKSFIGQTARITIGYQQGSGDSFAFNGFVTQLYLSKQASSGSSLVIKGFSASVLLEQGSRYQAFYQSDHSQIVDLVLKAYDRDLLKPSVKPRASRTEEYVVKFDETSYNFLHRFAAATGNWFYFDGEKTVFGDVPSESPIKLTYGEDMSAFDMQMNLPGGEFFVNDYNPVDNEYAKSHSKDVRVSGLGEYGQLLIDKAENLYPERTYSRSPLPALTNADAKLFAGYEKKASVANAVIFAGTSNKIGLKVGATITIGEQSGLAGQRTASFGQYRIISISHEADLGGGYNNHFEAIPAGVEFRANPSFSMPRATMQAAEVLHNDDPEHLGRVRVLFDWQVAQGDAVSSTWIRVLTTQNHAVNQGVYFVPEVSSNVMVMFEDEDPARPVVVGVTYDKSTKQDSFYHQENHYKTIITRGGNHIVICDESGKESISLYNRDKKNHISLSLDNTHITVKSEGILNLEADTINLKAKTFNVDASDEWTVKAGKAQLETQQSMALKASTNLTLTGTAGADLEGATIAIKSDATTSVKGGAQLELDGGPMATLKGGMVMIN